MAVRHANMRLDSLHNRHSGFLTIEQCYTDLVRAWNEYTWFRVLFWK